MHQFFSLIFLFLTVSIVQSQSIEFSGSIIYDDNPTNEQPRSRASRYHPCNLIKQA